MTLAEFFKTHPELKKEWDTEANAKEGISPEKVTHSVRQNAWWHCAEGHSWQAAIDSRTIMERGCPYCVGKMPVVGVNDIATVNKNILKTWDYEKNTDISPEQVTEGSTKKVWWKCEKGHSWQATIASRTNLGRGCPYCANKKVLAGYNDLATTNKDILKFWNYEKNTDISPTEITEFSHKKVWWKCEKGHSWQQTVDVLTSSKTMASGCPVCCGKKVEKGYNDLLFLYPEVAKEWCYELNKLKPDEVVAGAKKMVWWKCELGHTWKTPVFSRTGTLKTKCPYCAHVRIWEGFNDLKTINPHLASEWHDELNGDLKPTQVGKGSHNKVWWECGAGHVWEARVYSRAKENGTGCPVCAGVVKKPKDYYLDPDTNAIKRLNKSKNKKINNITEDKK